MTGEVLRCADFAQDDTANTLGAFKLAGIRFHSGMTRSWLWKGDRFVAADSVPLMDRGFRYGMSVFESVLVCNGAAHFLREHLQRLKLACERCGFAAALPPFGVLDELLRDADANGFARIYVTAGAGGITDEFAHGAVFVFLEERTPPDLSAYERGYHLGLSLEKHAPLLGGLKTGNYWANALAFRIGVARQQDETVLFNEAGELISACMANVFLVRGGKLFTPPISTGARDGVIRAWVLARRNVQQCALAAHDVKNAEEIFLTSSWLGIMPAASVERTPLRSQDLANDLLREYRALIEPSARPASK